MHARSTLSFECRRPSDNECHGASVSNTRPEWVVALGISLLYGATTGAGL